MENKGVVIVLAVIAAAVAALGITFFFINKNKIQKKAVETTAEQVIETTTMEETTTQAVLKIEGNVDTFISDDGKVTIEYPVIKNMKDADWQNKINTTLKNNATSIVSLYPIDTKKQSASIKCQINYIDDSRISVFYTGQIDNTNIFYTNTIDLLNGHNVQFKELLAPQAMANLLSKGKEEFLNVDDATAKQLRSYIMKNYSKKTLQKMFENADFSDQKIAEWPKVFSYSNGDTVYFSIKVSSKLGDFAIVKYTLETK